MVTRPLGTSCIEEIVASCSGIPQRARHTRRGEELVFTVLAADEGVAVGGDEQVAMQPLVIRQTVGWGVDDVGPNEPK